MKPSYLREIRSLIYGALLLAPCLIPGPALAQAPVPFACTGEAFIVQDLQAKLFQINQSITPFDLVPLGDANMNSTCDAGEDCNLEDPMGSAVEVNNLGFRRSDGFLYAAQVDLGDDANSGVVRIDQDGTVFPLGSPAGLPTDVGFNAGDVAADGDLLYLNQSGRDTLYTIDLTPLDAMMPPVLVDAVAITGPTTGPGSVVLDWASNPLDGLLYGGDRQAQVARLDPATGVRTDFTVVDGGGGPLSVGADFGGAWFDLSGRLFLFDNAGKIYEIDLGNLAAPTPEVVRSQAGDSSTRNDAAACIQDIVGAAKEMTSSNGAALPATITITYAFENFSSDSTLTLVSVIDDLTQVFGVRDTDWTFGSIASSGISHNSGFNGDTDPELIDQTPPGQDLAPGATASVTVTLTLLTDAADTDLDDVYCNQVMITGSVAGIPFGDLSTDGADPDPNGDDSPGEREPSCLMQVPVELMTFSIE